MNSHIPKLIVMALFALLAWGAPALGGDDAPRGPRNDALTVAGNDDLFRIDSRGRGGDNPFRLDGGRSRGHDDLFRLDGQRRGRDGRDDGKDGRRGRDSFRSDDGRRGHDSFRSNDGRRGRDDFRNDGRRGDGSRGNFKRIDDDGRRGRGRSGDDLRRNDFNRSPGHFSTPPERFDRRGEYRNWGHDSRKWHDSKGRGRNDRHYVKHVVHHLPSRHAVILHGRDRYHYHGGRFYRPWDTGFVLVRPPLGLIVLSLPLGSRTVISAGIPFYVFGDVYYRRVPAGYEVVEPIRAPGREWPAQVAVVTDILNLRYGPDESEEVIAQAGRYTVLNVLGSAPGWLYVEIDGEDVRGWVMERYVSTDLGNG